MAIRSLEVLSGTCRKRFDEIQGRRAAERVPWTADVAAPQTEGVYAGIMRARFVTPSEDRHFNVAHACGQIVQA
jgi:hypothetical protein